VTVGKSAMDQAKNHLVGFVGAGPLRNRLCSSLLGELQETTDKESFRDFLMKNRARIPTPVLAKYNVPGKDCSKCFYYCFNCGAELSKSIVCKCGVCRYCSEACMEQEIMYHS
jgi:hypothetical protein